MAYISAEVLDIHGYTGGLTLSVSLLVELRTTAGENAKMHDKLRNRDSCFYST